MVRAAQPSSLNRWRDRAAALSPLLADALDACADQPLDEAGCADVLDLLDMLGCDAQTLAAALWFELARVAPAVWKARSESLPAALPPSRCISRKPRRS